MTLQEILVQQQLTTALIVDDAYDQVPKAGDLGAENEAWSNFIDDLGEDRAAVIEAFPAFEQTEVDDLRRSDTFVAAMWNAKGKIREGLWKELFDGYEQATRSDRAFLTKLEGRLKAVGIQPTPSGRQIAENARAAPIIFADLFLGAAQRPDDITRSIEGIKKLVAGREANPPLVILMSRSDLLDDKKADFRDDAKLLGAMFRVYRKADLLEGSNLERALQRLALHRPDAIRVAAFLSSWEQGLKAASERFLKGIRRLDLSDYGQMRQILLTFEGQPLGSYLLDIFDRVLAHEIEGDPATIKAAEELNKIDPETYPAPHIAGSTDLQELVYRTIWQNPNRLSVKATEADIPVGFGDVLVKRSLLTPPQAAGQPAEQAVQDDLADAFVVLTPACDLVRDGVKRVLLLSGKLADLTPKTWIYKGGSLRTPIVILHGGRRLWAQWDVKDIRTLTPGEITQLIGENGSHKTVLRLRESHALELQQRLLTDMGRVGLVAQMPATFPVGFSASYSAADKTVKPYTLPKGSAEGGVCYVGRDGSGNENTKLVLTEPVIDELLSAIAAVAEDQVNPKTLDTFKRLQGPTSLAADLQKGMATPANNRTGYTQIKAEISGPDGQVSNVVVGLIARGQPKDKPDLKHAALILNISDDVAGPPEDAAKAAGSK